MTRPGHLLLADARFRRLWIGQAISELGDGMTGLALVVVVSRLAGTMSAVALMTILTSLPQVLLGLHAGVLVDRWDRRRVMIACDLTRAALVAGLLLVQEPSRLAWVYGLAIAQAAASVFFEPARTAFIPALVAEPMLLAANGFSQSTRVVSTTAGAALAGLLLVLPHGSNRVFAIDALSFAISALTLASIRVRARAAASLGAEPDARHGLAAELSDGLRLLFRSRTLVGLLTTFTITLLGMGAVSVLFVPYMLHDLHASTIAIGFVRAAQTLGMLLGGALLAGPASRLAPTRVLTLGIAGLAPCLALMGLAPHWLALLPLLALCGVCSSAIQAGNVTLLMHAVPDAARGRVESALDTLLVAVMLIAMAGAGVLGDRFGARAVFVLAGVLALAGGLAGRAWLSERPAHTPPTAMSIAEFDVHSPRESGSLGGGA